MKKIFMFSMIIAIVFYAILTINLRHNNIIQGYQLGALECEYIELSDAVVSQSVEVERLKSIGHLNAMAQKFNIKLDYPNNIYVLQTKNLNKSKLPAFTCLVKPAKKRPKALAFRTQR